MAAKTKIRNIVTVIVLVLPLTIGYARAQKIPVLQLASTISNGMLATNSEKTIIVATDISPDASRLAILYGVAIKSTATPVYNELWIAIWDIHADRLIKRTEVARSEQNSDVFVVGPLDVKFTADQKSIVVLGLRQVWIVDAANCSIRYSVKTPGSDIGFPNQILLPSNSLIAVTYERDGQQFYTVVYSIPSGGSFASWRSAVAPQSFSADAQLAAMPDLSTYNNGGVSNVAIVSSRTGEMIRTVSVGFAFPKSWLGKRKAHGSVVARFINDKEIMAAPDGSRDSTGHHSGDGVEIINAIDGHMERKIALDNYGPTGVIAESIDRKWMALESIYAHPIWFSIESANPDHFVHSLRLLATSNNDSQFVVPWPSIQASKNSLPMLSIPPRVSSVGPTAVITVGSEISVFRGGK